MKRYLLASSFHTTTSMDSWNSKSQDTGRLQSTLWMKRLCSLPLAGMLYGSSDKGHSMATPSAPCPELALLECTNCC